MKAGRSVIPADFVPVLFSFGKRHQVSEIKQYPDLFFFCSRSARDASALAQQLWRLDGRIAPRASSCMTYACASGIRRHMPHGNRRSWPSAARISTGAARCRRLRAGRLQSRHDGARMSAAASFNALRSAVRRGASGSLMSVRGGDAAGDTVSRGHRGAGIADLSGRFLDRTTPSYTAMLDREGDLIVGVADMALYDLAFPKQMRRSRCARRSPAPMRCCATPTCPRRRWSSWQRWPPASPSSPSPFRRPRWCG